MSFVAGFDVDAPKYLPIQSPPMRALSALRPKPTFEHMEQSTENTNNQARRRESMVERSTSEKTVKTRSGRCRWTDIVLRPLRLPAMGAQPNDA